MKKTIKQIKKRLEEGFKEVTRRRAEGGARNEGEEQLNCERVLPKKKGNRRKKRERDRLRKRERERERERERKSDVTYCHRWSNPHLKGKGSK